VKEQIWSKRFTQDIIDILGPRWGEIVLPWPKDTAKRAEIGASVKSVMSLRIEARTIARNAVMSVAPHSDWDETVDYDFIVLNG
jgi:type I restriction enzyme M protein